MQRVVDYDTVNRQIEGNPSILLSARFMANGDVEKSGLRAAANPSFSDKNTSDSDLLERIGRHQDRDAFASLFKKLGPKVKAYIMKLGATPELAEEITQEVFVLVWRKSALFDARKSAAVTWIFTIARNQRIDRLRKERRPTLDADDPLLIPDDIPTPHEEVEQAIIAKRVRDSIEALPFEQREAVRLSFLEGLTHQEIANRLDTPLGTVKSRLRLSFEKLRLSLGEFE